MGKRSNINGTGGDGGWWVVGSWGPVVKWGEFVPSKGDIDTQHCPLGTSRNMGPVLPYALIFLRSQKPWFVCKMSWFWKHYVSLITCFHGQHLLYWLQFAAPVSKVQVTSYLPESWREKEYLSPVKQSCSMNYTSPGTYRYVFISVSVCVRVCVYSWLLNSTGFNCKGPFVHGFFSNKYSTCIFILKIFIF